MDTECRLQVAPLVKRGEFSRSPSGLDGVDNSRHGQLEYYHTTRSPSGLNGPEYVTLWTQSLCSEFTVALTV